VVKEERKKQSAKPNGEGTRGKLQWQVAHDAAVLL
jgi:hypothetical protein